MTIQFLDSLSKTTILKMCNLFFFFGGGAGFDDFKKTGWKHSKSHRVCEIVLFCTCHSHVLCCQSMPTQSWSPKCLDSTTHGMSAPGLYGRWLFLWSTYTLVHSQPGNWHESHATRQTSCPSCHISFEFDATLTCTDRPWLRWKHEHNNET